MPTRGKALNDWLWERIDTDRSGAAGDLAKMFKNEGVKNPGALNVHAPPPDATLLAREVIQNSWDAAQELRAAFDGDHPDFEVAFRFSEHPMADHALLDGLGLRDHAERALASDSTDLGLGGDNVLDRLDSDAPLRLLTIEESGTTGMYGPWTGTSSKLYLALVSLGFTMKADGAGGSYGYGKAGLIRASRTRTIIAYTCFREQPDEPGVSRRLLGMTYWGLHSLKGIDYSGFARLGARDGDARVPLVDDEADAYATSLGLDVRHPECDEDLGTTFVVVDPGVEPEEVLAAIERNWWPAIQSLDDFHAEVVDYEGKVHVPRPKRDPVLLPFIRAHEVATVAQDNRVEQERQRTFQAKKAGDVRYELGELGLVADKADWSYPVDTDEVEHRSLVALVRGPKMVVEYYEAGTTVPFVRGTFVAANAIDDLLRQTEPKAHDAWEPTAGGDDVHPHAPEIAKTIGRRIRSAVNDFRSALRPPLPDRREIRLPEFERLFDRLFDADAGPKKPPPPPGPPRAISINVPEESPEMAPEGMGQIRMRAQLQFRTSDHVASQPADVIVRVRYKFLEDDRAAEECPLTVNAPAGWDEIAPQTFRGTVGVAETASFTAVSASYDQDWSGRLVAEADLASEFLVAHPKLLEATGEQ